MRFFGRQGWGRTLLLMAMVMVGAVCVSYGDNPPTLVGQWVNMKDGKSVELFKDGTGVIDNKNISWKTEGKRFVLSEGSTSRVGDYNLSGYEIKRTFENGEVVVWVRKDKVEEYKKKKMKETGERLEKISSYFTDSRNGQKYRSVKISGTMWMAQNLNYQTGNSWCYGGDNSNCEKYGRLYDWNTAKTACPAGWRLPLVSDWEGLVALAGGSAALKSTYGWDNYGNGTDEYGFSALPGGSSGASVGTWGGWWTGTTNGSDNAFRMAISGGESRLFKDFVEKGSGYSLRCIQDAEKIEEERLKTEAEQRNKKISTYFTDSRNGQKYRSVKIGGKTWMAENLNYKMDNSWCYENDESMCKQYGRLYDWNTAKTVCPTGWHLPTQGEWTVLVDYAGGSSVAGSMLKSTSGCKETYKSVMDMYGFSGLPGGQRYRSGDVDIFAGVATYGLWWTATENRENSAYYLSMFCYENGAILDHQTNKSLGQSVRCIQDENEMETERIKAENLNYKKEEEQRKKLIKEAEQRIEKISNYFTDSRNSQKYRTVKIGEKTWMAQNLNYQTDNSWCYDNNDSKCEKYGRLYDWNTAKTACPRGWYLPSHDEWDQLSEFVGGTEGTKYKQGSNYRHWLDAGKKLKSMSGWDDNNNGTDDFGFSALPGGDRSSIGYFHNAGNGGNWWAATEGNDARDAANSAYYWKMLYDENDVRAKKALKSEGMSVRCVSDDVR